MVKLEKFAGRSVLILAFLAFMLSFEKLHHVALLAGINPRLSVVYPVIVEGFTTLATMAAFLKRGQKGAWYPWAVGLAAFLFSLMSNAVPEKVSPALIRAVPVICIPLMVHMWIIIRGIAEERTAAEARAVELEKARQAQAAAQRQAQWIAQQEAAAVAAKAKAEAEAAETARIQAEAEAKKAPSFTQRASRSAANFLEMAKNATSPEAQAYWEQKAATAAA